MYNFLARKGQLVAFGLGGLLTLIFLLIVFGGVEEFSLMTKPDNFQTTIFDFGLMTAIALTGICFVFALGFGLYQAVLNPKGAITGIVGIVAIVAIFFIGKSMAAPDTGKLAATVEKFQVEDISANISGEITLAIALAVIAVGAFVVFEILNIFK